VAEIIAESDGRAAAGAAAETSKNLQSSLWWNILNTARTFFEKL